MNKLDFRLWLEEKESKKQKVRSLLDGQNLILFFTKGDNIYGAPEESRLVFAKLKDPGDDMPKGWADDANFAAFDLIKALTGERVQNMFSHKDLGDIKILDDSKVEDMLMKSAPGKSQPAKITITHGKHGGNMLKLKDKKI